MKRNKDGNILNYFTKVPKSQELPSCSSHAEINVEDVVSSTVVDPVVGVYSSDIKYYNPSKLNEEEKFSAINSLASPDSNFNYPQRCLHGKNLKFQPQWLDKYKWLHYSSSTDAAYCKYCFFFEPSQAGKLMTGFVNWKKALETFDKHQNAIYHKKLESIIATRHDVFEGKIKPLNVQLDCQLDVQKKSNRSLIAPIIEAIILCGQQNIALRGKHDSGGLFSSEVPENDGNLRSLLRWRAKSDNNFMQSVQSSGKNATYLSPTIQNEIIFIIENIIITRRIEKLKQSPFFSIYADETSDVSGQEQMAIGVRYFDSDSMTTKEDFLKFISITDMTALGISTELLKAMHDLNINLDYCVGQGYDGAAVMAGEKSGVAVRVKKFYPKALYVHCLSHCLNLVLTDSCNLLLIKNCNNVIRSIYNYFNTPKRQNILSDAMKKTESVKKKLKNFNPTRFVERHQTTATFIEMLEGIIFALHDASKFDADAIGHLNSIHSFEFLIALLTLDFVLSITIGFSRYLQTVDIDLILALEGANNCLDVLKSIQSDLTNEFKTP
jgi:Domain of unknown function (DUF4371)